MRKNNPNKSKPDNGNFVRNGRTTKNGVSESSSIASTRVVNAKRARARRSKRARTLRESSTLDELLRRRPDVGRRLDEAIAASNSGQVTKSLAILKELVDEHPDQGPLQWYLAGTLQYRASDPAAALPHYQRAVALHPRTERASKGLFHCLWDLDRIDEALGEIKRFQQLTHWKCKDYIEIVEEIREKWLDHGAPDERQPTRKERALANVRKKPKNRASLAVKNPSTR